MAQVATAIGAACAGPIQDRFGRKFAFAIAGFISFAGVSVIFTSSTPSEYLAGKIVNGLALGIALTTGQTYISEGPIVAESFICQLC
jgi:SP family general alpha glucoside:H+ symporter-like MFS transporter